MTGDQALLTFTPPAVATDHWFLCVMPAVEARWLVGEHGPLSRWLAWPQEDIVAQVHGRGVVVLNEAAVQSLRHASDDGRVEDRDGVECVIYGQDYYWLRDLGPHQGNGNGSGVHH